MNGRLVAQAIALFAVTNIDDLVVLTVFFGRSSGRDDARRVVLGQYLGFGGILAISALGALGAGVLPASFVPYLGLVPLVLGLRAGWQAWRHRADNDDPVAVDGPGVLAVAGVTFANGGDNLGVYIPVFATTGNASLAGYVTVFLILVGIWCMVGHGFARRPLVARTLSRWGHIVLPVVLVGIGLKILIDGGVVR